MSRFPTYPHHDQLPAGPAAAACSGARPSNFVHAWPKARGSSPIADALDLCLRRTRLGGFIYKICASAGYKASGTPELILLALLPPPPPSAMFEYITARILHTPLGKRVDELVSGSELEFPKVSLTVTLKPSQLAKVQALDSPPDQGDSLPRSSSLPDMLNEMAIHSRHIQDRITLEGPPRARAAVRNSNSVPPSLPPQESIIHSLYAIPPSSPDYSVIASDHRFPQNVVRCRQRPHRSRRPPPAYSEEDPNPSISATLSEIGLCVRGGVAPQLPPSYSLLPPAPGDC